MLDRFTGNNGRDLAIEALRNQAVIGSVSDLAEQLYDTADILDFSQSTAVVEESAPDNDIYFILSGVASIRVSQREVAERTAGQTIGEMSVVDPGKPRSASVFAKSDVIAARVSASDFVALADTEPRLWRNIARVLADRLRQRNQYVLPVNRQPILFIGCSTESLEIGRSIQSALTYDDIETRLWTDNVFDAGSFAIESLERELQSVDFAALVLSPDDTVISREATAKVPRDNLIFELGLFMGALGRSRALLVCPRGVELKIPSDLLGLTSVMYDPTKEGGLATSIATACNEIRTVMLTAGPR